MESFSTSDGRTLAFRRRGAGRVLVCHPGGPGFSSRYFGDLAGLDEVFEIVLLDPRGTGDSARPTDPRADTTDDYVGDLEEVRLHLGLDRLLLLGHSHGGVVAQAYAARHAGRVERLVLASTLARFQEEQVVAMASAIEARSGEDWYEDGKAALEAEQAGGWETEEELAGLVLRELPFYFARYGTAERTYVAGLEGEIPNGDALRLFNDEFFTSFDLRPELGRIQAPTLVITGEDDFITGPVCARELAGGIAGARLEPLPNCGHFVFVEQRERFGGVVPEFLLGGDLET
jgi:proline iminopeptidase